MLLMKMVMLLMKMAVLLMEMVMLLMKMVMLLIKMVEVGMLSLTRSANFHHKQGRWKPNSACPIYQQTVGREGSFLFLGHMWQSLMLTHLTRLLLRWLPGTRA